MKGKRKNEETIIKNQSHGLNIDNGNEISKIITCMRHGCTPLIQLGFTTENRIDQILKYVKYAEQNNCRNYLTDKLLSQRETAKFLGFTERQVRILESEGKFSRVAGTTRPRYWLSDIISYVNGE